MPTFCARLYGDNISASGMDVVARFEQGVLLIELPHTTMTCAVPINPVAGGFKHDELLLNWQAEDGINYSLIPKGNIDLKAILSSAPTELSVKFAAWHTSKQRIKTIWISIVAVLATVVLASVVTWWQHDLIVDWVASHVSIEEEIRLGNESLEMLKKDNTLIDSGTAVEAMQVVGSKLLQNSPYAYRWYIIEKGDPNAFALPGGIIVVHSTLFSRLKSPEELAALLAHEVQHVEQRHVLKEIIATLGWSVILAVASGGASLVAVIATYQMGTLYYSREVEEQADRLGVEALKRANIYPYGMIDLFNTLLAIQATATPEWLSTHPSLQHRIDNVRTYLVGYQCPSCKKIDMVWR